MIKGLIIPFITISLAELGDKSQLSLFLLATKTNKRFLIFFGAITAFFLVDGLAVLLGENVANLLPINIMKIISGIIFISIGLITLFLNKKGKTKKKNYSYGAFASAFLLIFFTEWGDKTQIATFLFASKYNGWLVFIGVLMALSLLSLLVIYLGNKINSKINYKIIKTVSGIIFILLGLFCFI